MRRKYKSNVNSAAMIYLIYLCEGEQAAINYTEKTFGKVKSNGPLINKLKLYGEGGWEKDWLTNMYRDIDKILKKYS